MFIVGCLVFTHKMPVLTIKNVFRDYQMSPGEQNHPELRTIVLKQCLLIGGVLLIRERGLKTSSPGSLSQRFWQFSMSRVVHDILIFCNSASDLACALAGISHCWRVKLTLRNFPLWQGSFLPELDLLSGGKEIDIKPQLISLILDA